MKRILLIVFVLVVAAASLLLCAMDPFVVGWAEEPAPAGPKCDKLFFQTATAWSQADFSGSLPIADPSVYGGAV